MSARRVQEDSYPRKIYDYFINHWIITSIFISSTSYYFVILRLWGTQLHLRHQENLTLAGSITSLTIIVLNISFSVIKTLADRTNEEGKKNAQFVYSTLLGNLNASKKAKLDRFLEFIKTYNDSKERINPFLQITHPEKQIKILLENIQTTFSELFGIERDEIGISILYNTNNNTNWEWIHKINTGAGLSLSDLISNPKTAARQIIDGKKHFLFYPDKRIAIENNEYIAGPMDERIENIGSVYCQNISLSADHVYIRAILSISTYGTQLCSTKVLDSQRKIINKILKPFEERIKLELALLYIKKIMNIHCNECPALVKNSNN